MAATDARTITYLLAALRLAGLEFLQRLHQLIRDSSRELRVMTNHFLGAIGDFGDNLFQGAVYGWAVKY